MIVRKRMITLAIVVAGCCYLGLSQLPAIWRSGNGVSSNINDADVTRYRTYVVGQEDWLEYQLPQHAQSLRLFTNAALQPDVWKSKQETSPYDRPGYQYSLQYELVDRHGNVLSESEYHFRAPLLHDPAEAAANPSQISAPKSFFGKTRFVPAKTRTMQLPIGQWTRSARADRLRLRVNSKDESIREVVTRLYAREERSKYDDAATWHRLSQPTREKLTRACVYPAALLDTDEKRNLLHWRWSAASPVGYTSRDYEMRRMFIPDDSGDADEDATPDGFEVNALHRAVVPLPDQLGDVTVELDAIQSANVQSTSDSSDTVTIQWVGRGGPSQAARKYSVDASPIRIRPPTPGGMLCVASTSDIAARFEWQDGEDDAAPKIDITPAPRSVRLYRVDPQQPIDFSVTHVNEQATPFCLKLRSQVSGGRETERVAADMISWQFLDGRGRTVRQGKLDLQSNVSVYDRLSLNSHFFPVSDPAIYYFWVPAGVDKVRINSKQDEVLASAYTRVANLPRHTVVPDDYVFFGRANSNRKSWFTIRPDRYDERVAGTNTISCHVQRRLPEQKDYLLNGDFTWDQFVPEKSPAARELLTKIEPHTPTRDEALPATFTAIPTTPFTARWLQRKEHRYVTPKLVYQIIGEDDRQPEVHMVVDGKLKFRKKLQSRTGSIPLPLVDKKETGKDLNMQFKTTGRVRLFVNYLDAPGMPRFLRRTANEITPSMSFKVRKESSGRELLMLRVFQSQQLEAEPLSPLSLNVTVHPPDSYAKPPLPTRSQSLIKRTYQVRAQNRNAKDGSIVLGADRQGMDAGQLCFIALNEDLPIGEYRIDLTVDGDGLVMLYRSLPGRRSKGSMFLEQVDE